jgi:hypothetical protein
VAGGDLTYTNGQVSNGSLGQGGSAAVSNVGVPNGEVLPLNPESLPVDFLEAESCLLNLCSVLTGLPPNGETLVNYWGGSTTQITLRGEDPEVNVPPGLVHRAGRRASGAGTRQAWKEKRKEARGNGPAAAAKTLGG